MTKHKKSSTEKRKFAEEMETARNNSQKLTENDEAFSRGAFKYLRILIHLLGFAQFTYGAYYQWNLHFDHEPDEAYERANWGGKLRFLTFLNVVLQSVYHLVALLNDFFGSNALTLKKKSVLQSIRDYIFIALAFPISLNVCITFWVIYAIDRELIFPAVLDAIFPNWLNHIVHTNVGMLCLLDLFTCFRQYPRRRVGLSGNLIFMVAYIIWLHVVHFYSGTWVYPILDILNMPLRYLFFIGLLAFSKFYYLVGEYLNKFIWAPQIELVKIKFKHK